MLFRLLCAQSSTLFARSPFRPTSVAPIACRRYQHNVCTISTSASWPRPKTAITAQQPKSRRRLVHRQARRKAAVRRRAAVQPKREELGNPDSWMRQLERFLPSNLRFSDARHPLAEQDILEAVHIIDRARHFVGNDFDLLEHMLVTYGRDQAVLSLFDDTLKAISSRIELADELPSNICWPAALFDKGHAHTFDVEEPTRSMYRHHGIEEKYQYHTRSGTKQLASTMRQIWLSLGHMTITAAKIGGVQSQQIMSTVYQALAKIHHYDLVPEAIYTYQPTAHSSILNRPPILHLLSSRILTTLSDAVWRSQQEQVIAQAVESGTPLSTLSRDPPGGRFRLKVREMGPEVWLEFILWCCVEGRYASTGAKIVDQLRKDADHPWFAINWTSNDIGRSAPLVHWDRVNSRTGGTVGRIEGYSREEPLANVPARTISAEVVLALAEGLVSASDIGHLVKPLLLERTARNVKSLISFLEPHSLPVEYFDYLSARLLHTEKIDYESHPRNLDIWAQVTNELRDLESAHDPQGAEATFEYSAIVSQSLLSSGLTQQVLTAYIHNDHYLKSIEVFSRLQYQVDKTKLQHVIEFVRGSHSEHDGFFDTRPATARREYVDSYGELPYHARAAFLHHMVGNGQFDMAEWMLYSDDVDGPSIPSGAYSNVSVASALTRLAPELGDDTILRRIAEAGRKWRLKPAVKLLRHLVDAHIKRLDFKRAEVMLEQLRETLAGGYSPTNLATLAATILRLQVTVDQSSNSTEVQYTLLEALSLLQRILSGAYDGVKGDYYQTQRRLFRQQVGHLLRVLENLPRTRLYDVATRFRPQYPTGNAPNLTPAAFDILLSGIVETLGAQQGRRVWNLFCKDPRAAAHADGDRRELELFLSDVSAESGDDVANNYEPQVNEASDDDFGVYGAVADGAEEPEHGSTLSEYEEQTATSDVEARVAFSDISFSAPNFDNRFVLARSDWDLPAPIAATRPSVDQDQPMTPSTSTLQHVQDTSTDSNPLVIPRLSTMRIILRKALLERGSALSNDIIKWAASYMREAGLTLEDIEQETSATGQSASTKTQQDVGVEETSPPEQRPVSVRTYFVSGAEHIHRKRDVLWERGFNV